MTRRYCPAIDNDLPEPDPKSAEPALVFNASSGTVDHNGSSSMKASEGKLVICRTVIARMPLVCVVAFALGASGPTEAAVPDANGVFHACYERSGGALRVVNSTKTACRLNGSPILWNRALPQG